MNFLEVNFQSYNSAIYKHHFTVFIRIAAKKMTYTENVAYMWIVSIEQPGAHWRNIVLQHLQPLPLKTNL